MSSSDKDFAFEVNWRNKRYRSAEDGLKSFGKSIEKSIAGTAPVMKRELKQFLIDITESLARRHGNPYPGGTGAKTLSRRSGAMISKFKESVTVQGSNLDDIVGSFSGPHYARAQEYGATITARKAKYLTIPLPAALNSNGTPKKKSAREWKDTFVIKSKKGNLLIVQKQGSGILPLYVLKKQVKIPARLGVRETIAKGIPYFVDTVIEQMVKEVLNG